MIIFAAIICVSGFISIPNGIIPISPQNTLAIISGSLFGLPQGPATVGIFLMLGFFNLPVFAGGAGGIAAFTSPTGGFILGYFFGSIVCAFIAKKPTTNEKNFNLKALMHLYLSFFAGLLVTYVTGLIQFMQQTSTSFPLAISATITPGLYVEIIKGIVIVPIVAKLRPIVARVMYPPEDLTY